MKFTLLNGIGYNKFVMEHFLVHVCAFLSSDKPSAPKNLKAPSVTETTVSLSWEVPDDNGGSDIMGYVVEKREASKRSWTAVSTVENLETVVESLTEGTKYMFRVAAQNEVGVGEFAELEQAVQAKSPHGESFIDFKLS